MKSVSQVYESLDLEKKGELVGIVCSNSTWKDGKLTPTFRNPFDFIAQFNQNKNAAPALEGAKSGVSEVWLAESSTNTEGEACISNHFSACFGTFEDSFGFRAQHGGRKGILLFCDFTSRADEL